MTRVGRDPYLDELDSILNQDMKKVHKTPSSEKETEDEDVEEDFVDEEEDVEEDGGYDWQDEDDDDEQSQSVHIGNNLVSVRNSKVIIVSVLIDDSGSMKERGKTRALEEGIRSMYEGFLDAARKGKDIHFILCGFKKTYFTGNILDFNVDSMISDLNCDHDCTPLTTTSIKLSRTTDGYSDRYRSKGISSHVSMLLMTDGDQNSGEHELHNFQGVVRSNRHWRIYGYGITSEGFSPESVDAVFREMGITRRTPTKPEELAQAMFEFSQSASAF